MTMIVLISIFTVIFFSSVFFLCDYTDYQDSVRSSEIEPITFKQFSKIFNINQERWELNCNFASYYYGPYQTIDISFKTYWDWLKYKRYRKKRIKFAQDEKKIQTSLSIIKEWRKDIAECESKSKEELAKAEKFLKEKYYNGV